MRTTIFIFIWLFMLGCKNQPAVVSSPKKSASTQQEQQLKSLSLVHKVRQPKTQSKQTPALILLHGLGSNENDLISLAEHIDDRMLVISARAPLTLASNKYSWFNLNRTENGWSYKDEEVLASSKQLIHFIEEIKERYKITGPIYLGGFSQGAIMSLGTALRHPDKIKGVLCLSGQLYPAFLDEHRRNYTQLEVLVTHGRNDAVLPFKQIEQDVKTLINKGLNPQVHYYDTAHTISTDNYSALLEWLAISLNKNL